MGFGQFRPKHDCPFQVGDRGRQISLLAKNEAEQIVCLSMLVVGVNDFGELFTRGVQLAASRGFLRSLVGIVCRAGRCRAWLVRSGALLLQGHAERVVAFAQLGFDLERTFERRHGAGKIAALAQRLTELVLNARIVRIAGDDTLQVIQCPFQIAFLAQRTPQVQMGD